MFYTYILQSEVDHSFYIGFTSDLTLRLEKHNQGKSRYTKKKIPWNLVYWEEFDTKSAAIIREKFLKRQRNKSFYLGLIQEFKKKR